MQAFTAGVWAISISIGVVLVLGICVVAVSTRMERRAREARMRPIEQHLKQASDDTSLTPAS
jgi:hypothetical protein